MAASDLITLAYAESGLTEQNYNANQLAWLPSAITNASDLVCKWCGGRDFVQQDYDQIRPVTVSGYVFPLQRPVNWLTAVWTNRAVAINVTNTGQSTIQWATVRYALVGDQASGLTVSGLTLTWSANGTTTTQTIAWSSLTPATISSLATAINGLGNGWSAVVAPSFGGWAVSDLIWADVGAMNAFEGPGLQVWSATVDTPRLVQPGDFIDLSGTNIGMTSMQAPWNFGGIVAPGGDRFNMPPVRVQYNAGYATVPPAVQQATLEVVKEALARQKTELLLASESDGDYSYANVGPEVIDALPKSVRRQLEYYRIHAVG